LPVSISRKVARPALALTAVQRITDLNRPSQGIGFGLYLRQFRHGAAGTCGNAPRGAPPCLRITARLPTHHRERRKTPVPLFPMKGPAGLTLSLKASFPRRDRPADRLLP
jgi:hypothetical protein